MGTITKLFITLILIAVIVGMYLLELHITSKIFFYTVGVVCIAIGAKLWLD